MLFEDDQVQQLRVAKSTVEAWNSLRNYYQRNSSAIRLRLIGSLMQQRHREGESVKDPLDKLFDLYHKSLSLRILTSQCIIYRQYRIAIADKPKNVFSE